MSPHLIGCNFEQRRKLERGWLVQLTKAFRNRAKWDSYTITGLSTVRSPSEVQ
jgi:hypothetical protein